MHNQGDNMTTYKMDRELAVATINCEPPENSEMLTAYNDVDFDFTVLDWCEEDNDINDVCEFTGLSTHCVTIERV